MNEDVAIRLKLGWTDSQAGILEGRQRNNLKALAVTNSENSIVGNDL